MMLPGLPTKEAAKAVVQRKEEKTAEGPRTGLTGQSISAGSREKRTAEPGTGNPEPGTRF
jgi:hypothetical protein